MGKLLTMQSGSRRAVRTRETTRAPGRASRRRAETPAGMDERRPGPGIPTLPSPPLAPDAPPSFPRQDAEGYWIPVEIDSVTAPVPGLDEILAARRVCL